MVHDLRIPKAYNDLVIEGKQVTCLQTNGVRPIKRRLLLVGNSVNLVAKCHKNISYRDVLKKIIKRCGMEAPKQMSISEMQSLIADYEIQHPNESLFQQLMEQLKALRPTHAHHLLASLSESFDTILTLNFDYAMETALRVSACHADVNPLKSVPLIRKRKKVCHIHGSIGTDKKKFDCIISQSSYDTALQNYPEMLPDDFSVPSPGAEVPWWHDFITQEVHICGANLGDDEKILYRALELRLQWIERQPNRAAPWTNRIYAYLFETPGDKKKGSVKRVADKLSSLRVYPIIIPLRDTKSFNSAWEQLFGKMLLHFSNICVFPDGLKNLPLTKCAVDRTRYRNVSLSSVPDLKYPFYYVFVPSLKMLNEAMIQGIETWIFYVIRDTSPFYWSVDLSELLQFAKEINGPEGVQFYLDFSSGRLYALESLQPSPFTCKKINENSADKLICKIKSSRNARPVVSK